jgi:hypothetical protein
MRLRPTGLNAIPSYWPRRPSPTGGAQARYASASSTQAASDQIRRNCRWEPVDENEENVRQRPVGTRAAPEDIPRGVDARLESGVPHQIKHIAAAIDISI